MNGTRQNICHLGRNSRSCKPCGQVADNPCQRNIFASCPNGIPVAVLKHVARMQPVIRERVAENAPASVSDRHCSQKLIRLDSELDRYRHNLLKNLPPHGKTTRSKIGAQLQKLPCLFFILQPTFINAIWRSDNKLAPCLVRFINSVADRPYIGVSFELMRYHRELFSFPPVVAIQKCDNLALAFRNARIKRRGLPAILFAQQSHTRLKFFHDFRRAIRRAIVHNDDFTIRRRKILLQHAHDRLLDEALVVIRINQYAGKTLCQIAAPQKSAIVLPSQVRFSPSPPMLFLFPPSRSSPRKKRRAACASFERHPEHADDDSPGSA